MTDSARKIFYLVIAFLVSIAAWVFVVYNYYPMNQVRYTDVPVSFQGEEALAERGLAVSESSMETIAVTLSQKRVDGGLISSEDISVTADVSECVAGENNVELSVRGPSGTSVVYSSASYAAVEVARTRKEIMDIEVVYGEGAAGDEVPIASDLSSTSAEVSCSADKFGDIRRIAAVLSLEDVTEVEKSYTIKLQALDSDGEAIPHVVISPDEVSLDAYAGYMKKVYLTMNVRDDSDDGYERQYSAPSMVVIKGLKSAIDDIDSISSKEIDITYLYEDQDVEIEYELPEGVYVSDSSMGQKLRVKVTEKEDEEE